MFAYIGELIEAERAHPGDYPLGRLIKLEQEGEKISSAELISLAALMYSAGFGTTHRTIGNGFVSLLQHPEQAAALANDPSLARASTDEVLRYDATVMTVGYFVGADEGEAAGRRLAPGTKCTVLLGAANHDPTMFDRPEVFDIMAPRRHGSMTFGYGTHYCLGVNLSKLETDVVLGETFRRYPRMQLTETPVRKPSFRVREFVSVMAVLEPGG